MNKKLFLILGIVGFLALAGSSIFTPVSLADTDEKTIPEKNLVTMVDLGAKKCIPCKMMAPILVELEKEYAGRAAVIFIDVWEYPDKAQEFKVSIIPTQIFYDKAGKEVYRHVGFIDKESIKERLEKLLQ